MNILTFDIEEWFIEKTFHGGRSHRYCQFDETFSKLISYLELLQIKATFFCVGKLAHDFPQVVRTISEKGHEVGCHSNEHVWLNKMNEATLRRDTTDAIKALEDVSGKKIVSYRAPAFSITPSNKWAVSVLADCGIENDASVFPTDRDYGGYNGFPQDTPCIINHEGAKLKEYPISITSRIGKKIAYSGGGYFRLLPLRFIKRTVNKRDYNMFYFHLNDLINQRIKMKSKEEYEEYFKEPGTIKNRLSRYIKSNIGTGDAYCKMTELLSENTFINIQEADKLIDWNDHIVTL